MDGNDFFGETLSKFVQKLLYNKFVVIIGDSIQRAIYKDMVFLLQKDSFMTEKDLKAKGELSFYGDTLLEGGVMDSLNNGTLYREVRQYSTLTHCLRFYFVTRCYNDYVESIMDDFTNGSAPNVVIMNSCLWDVTRYGDKSIAMYKENLSLLFSRLADVLPLTCLMLWNTTMPISVNARGGFLVKDIDYDNRRLEMDVSESNYLAREIVVDHGFHILDLYFYFRRLLHWRTTDGVHWNSLAHRRVTELTMSFMSTVWAIPFPFHITTRSRETITVRLHRVPSYLTNMADRVQGKRRSCLERHARYHRPTPYDCACLPSSEAVNGVGNIYHERCKRDNHFHHHVHHTSDFHLDFSNCVPQPHLPLIPKQFAESWSGYSECAFNGPDRRGTYRQRCPRY